MTKCMKWLGVIAAAVIFAAGAMVASDTAHAESPPAPAARFVGKVTVDGQKVPAGTVISAMVGSASCGATTTFDSGGEARYVLDVPAKDPGSAPNCGEDGATVKFYIGDKPAIETGSWANYQLNTVNLTYITPTPTPVPTATAVPTPKPPSTGQGTESGAPGGLGLAIVLLAMGAGALGLGGVTAARRAK